MTSHKRVHKPVLLQEILADTEATEGDIFFDGTVGTGGYAKKILEINKNKNIKYIGVDLDTHALNQIKQTKHFESDIHNNKLILVEENFKNIFTIIKNYGEEKYARRIAKAIVQKREEQPIKSAKELSELISASLRWFEKKGKTNPSRRTMQAIRIAVNSELENLRTFLSCCLEVVEDLGVISIISFHSLEDRIVKHMFLEWEKKGLGKKKYKKPVCATEDEIEENKAARSAKLRTFTKN